jgi:transposase
MFTVCYLEPSGDKQIRTFKLSQIGVFRKSLNPDDQIALEVTGNSRYFHDQIVDSVSKVITVNPSQFKVISSSYKKTDEYDAEILALYLSKNLLPNVRVPGRKQARIKSLLVTRNRLVKLRTALKNKIHGILNSNGIVSKKRIFNTNKGLHSLKQLKLDNLSSFEISILVEQIFNLNESIKSITEELSKPENQMAGHDNLTSIKGIGDIGASIILTVIGDVKDFPSAKKLTAYFGLVPSVKKSNTTEHLGRITKRGSRLGRSTLVQCAWIAIKFNPRLMDFYQRIKNRKGSGKAIVATARKLLELIYFTLDQNIIWEDSATGIIKN